MLRQTAIICILAQMGGFVPAERARLPLLDRVWTRVGASDDLTRGRSTFMVEMTETAAILHSATPRSLVLLDEIGRGTATFDGLSIAWAVAEFLHDSPEHSAKTLFATHYHELTELAERLPGAQNYQITATEREGEVVFLIDWSAAGLKSYGIEVRGWPDCPIVWQCSRRRLNIRTGVFAEDEAIVSSHWPREVARVPMTLEKAPSPGRRGSGAGFFDLVNRAVVDELLRLDPETLSPDEAKELLRQLRERVL